MSSSPNKFKKGQGFIPFGLFDSHSVRIPFSLLHYEGMTPLELFVWGALAYRAWQDGKCYPSVSTIATDVGRSRRGVQLALKSLEKKGFIRILTPSKADIGKGKTNRYEFSWHPALEGSLKRSNESPRPGEKNCVDPVKKAASPSEQNAPKSISPNGEINTTTNDYSVNQNDLGCGGGIAEVSQEQERYISLKVEFTSVHGRIASSKHALRRALETKAKAGGLDMSDYDELKSWKTRQMGIRDCPPVKLPGTGTGEKAELIKRQELAMAWWNALPDNTPPKLEKKKHPLMTEAQWAVVQFGKYGEGEEV